MTLIHYIILFISCITGIISPSVTPISIDNNAVAIVEIEEEVEYPAATEIWEALQAVGYNNYVCAGILGNIMVEVGGGTLELKPLSETRNYYGICQWSKKYYPDIIGAELQEQCQFLYDTIEQEFKAFGYCYAKRFNYESFLALTDERQAALAFAKCYERCSAGGYTKRQNCATQAYEYFVGEK